MPENTDNSVNFDAGIRPERSAVRADYFNDACTAAASGGPDRDVFLQMSDRELSDCCRIDVFCGSGPGGQHRNRNYTAVRLVFKLFPHWVCEDVTSRSQKQNLTNALCKMRRLIAVKWRKPSGEKLIAYKHCNQSNSQYAMELARLLDVLYDCQLEHKAAAARLGISGSKLLKELATEHEVWNAFQVLRAEAGLPELKRPRS